MRITVKYFLSDAGRKKAFQRGLPAHREQEISIEDTENSLLHQAELQIDASGNACIDLQLRMLSQAFSVETFPGYIQKRTLLPSFSPTGKYWEQDAPLQTPLDVLTALHAYQQMKKDLLVAGRVEQAKLDAQFAGKMAERQQRLEEQAQKEAAEHAEAQRQESERRIWIQAHGSEFLRQAHAAGYDCQRLYATERAALEFPGFTLEFDSSSRWKSRSCPSRKAFEIAQATPPARVIWLTDLSDTLRTEWGLEDDEDSWGEDPWKEQEALLVADFLGKYDLLRLI